MRHNTEFKIHRVDFVREMYHEGFSRDLEDVEEVTIHGTGGARSASGIFNWMQNLAQPWEADRWKRGVALYHFLIDRVGEIYQLVDLDRWVYHSSSGQHDKKTIGIELINPVKDNQGGYTLQQYESLDYVLGNIILPLCPVERVSSHQFNYRNFSGGDKSCPGPLFNWSRLDYLPLDIRKAP